MSNRLFNVDVLFNVRRAGESILRDLTEQIVDLYENAEKGSRQAVLFERALSNLYKPIGGASSIQQLNQQINDLKKGLTTPEQFILEVSTGKTQAELNAVLRTLREVTRNLEATGNIEAFGSAAELSKILNQTSALLNKVIEENDTVTNGLKEQVVLYRQQAKEVENQIAQDRKRFENLKKLGEVTPAKEGLLKGLESDLSYLEMLRDKLRALGQSTTTIDIKIANSRSLIREVQNYKQSFDDLAKRNIDIKVSGSETIKQVNKETAELNKLLKEAEARKNIKIVLDVETRRRELEDTVSQIGASARAAGDAALGKKAEEAKVRLRNLGTEVSRVDQNIPRGIGGYFKNLLGSVNAASDAIKRTGGVTRATAGSLRLIGTAAFLVGGQFRTLGFGASALGNILQTYAPILSQLTAATGPLAPVFIALGAAVAAVVGQFAAFTVGIVSVIDTGFRFNNQFSKVQNSVSAVAREFFTFSSSASSASPALDDTAKAANNFALAGDAVGKQLEALQFEATQTEFTAQDLFEAFQSTTSALGNLSPSLEGSRKLTGLFARTASIARVPISQLGSSISQIIAGTGRITNPLVRDVFNKLKDSEGIALTAKRIRELRAEGGDRLFNELTGALQRFTAGVGELQATKTLSGAFSNLQDLFQIFSGRATKGAFDEVVKALVKVRDTIVQVNGEDITFTPSFEKLLRVVTAFIDRLGSDFSSIIERLTGWLEGLGGYFEDAYPDFIALYEALKSMLAVVGNIIADFVDFLALGKDGSIVFNAIRTVLFSIEAILTKVRIGMNLIGAAIGAVLRLVVFLAQGLGKVGAFFGSTLGSDLEEWAKRSGAAIEKNIQNRLLSAGDAVVKLTDSVGDLFGFSTFGNRPIKEQAAKDLQKNPLLGQSGAEVTNTPIPGSKQEEESKRASQRSLLALSEQYKKFFNFLFELNKEYNNLSLEEAKKAIETQQELIALRVELGFKSEIAAQREIEDLKIKSIQNEIESKKASLENDNKSIKANDKQLEITEKITRERGTAQEIADSINRAKEREIELANRLLKTPLEEKKLNAEIRDLENQKTKIVLDGLIQRTRLLINLRREAADLNAEVLSLQYPDSFIAVTARLNAAIEGLAERYTKINQEIIELSNSTDELDVQRVKNLREIRGLLLTQLALRQQQESFNATQLISERELVDLARQQELLQRDIDFGRISTEAGQRRIVRLNYEYSRALKAVLEQLKAINAINPDPGRLRQIQDLERTIQNLGETLTESTLLNATNSIRDNLVDTFVKIQENAGNAGEAIKDFARSILGTFRRLLAERIVRDLFKTLFPEPGQTQGKAGGLLASIFRIFGLDPATSIQKEVDAAPRNTGLEQKILDRLSQIPVPATLDAAKLEIENALNAASQRYLDSTQKVSDKLNEFSNTIGKVATTLSEEFFKAQFETVLKNFSDALTNATKNISEEVIKELRQYIRNIFGINLPGTTENGGINAPILSDPTRRGGGARGSVSSGGGGGGGGVGTRAGGGAGGGAGAPKGSDKAAPKSAEISKTPNKGTPKQGPIDYNVVKEARRLDAEERRIKNLPRIEPTFAAGSGAVAGGAARAAASVSFSRPILDEAGRLRTTLVEKGLTGKGNIGRFVGSEFFEGKTLEQLATYDISQGAEYRKFLDLMNFYINSAYQKFNSIPRAGGGKLNVNGRVLNTKTGKYDSFPLPAIAKLDVKALEKNAELNKVPEFEKVDYIADRTTNVFADVNSAVDIAQEISKLENDQKGIKANIQKDLENANKDPESRSLYEESAASREQASFALDQQIAEKTDLFNIINRRLSTVDYKPGMERANIPNILREKEKVKAEAKKVKSYLSPTFPYSPSKEARTVQRIGYSFGGPVFGKGGPTSDSIPAMLSNGEYVVNAKTVKKLGVPFFDRLNNVKQYATGGSLIDTSFMNPSYSAPAVNTSAFNYLGGGASLIRGAAPIFEAATKKATPQKRKKRGIFGNIISAIAPFLSAIPIFGPFLSLGAGALGGALSGSEKGVAGGILGGIFGGLSNLGGFAGGSGFLGKAAGFFGKEGAGAPFLSLLGLSGAGNLGNTIGQGAFGLFNDISKVLKTPRASARNMKTAVGDSFWKNLFRSSRNRFAKDQKLGNLNINKLPTSGYDTNVGNILMKLVGRGFAEGGEVAPSIAPQKGGGGFLSKLMGPLIVGLLGGMIPGFGIFAPLLSLFGGLFGKKDDNSFLGKFGVLGKLFPSMFRKKKMATGGQATGGIKQLGGPLLSLAGLLLPGLLNKQPKAPDYSIKDPDEARKNRFGSAYDALVEYGIIGEYKYQKETLEALRRGSRWVPIQRQGSNIGSTLNTILPFLFSGASDIIKNLPQKKASGGMVVGPGTGTSDSIPAWLSSGEYVIKASSVRSLGTDILDSINEGRFKFAKGGVAGEGVSTLPEIELSNSSTSETPVTVNSNTKVVNVLDPNLVGDYLQTNEGTRTFINLISKRSREIRSILER
jgi:hypothetical protein